MSNIPLTESEKERYTHVRLKGYEEIKEGKVEDMVSEFIEILSFTEEIVTTEYNVIVPPMVEYYGRVNEIEKITGDYILLKGLKDFQFHISEVAEWIE